MGRDFLLVNHNYFGELSMGRKFQTFFHKPSLSVVEVKVKEHSPVVNSLGTPETHMQDDPLPMVDVSYPPMPSQMQDDQLFLSSSRCRMINAVCLLLQYLNLIILALRIPRLIRLGKFFRTLLMDLRI